MATDLEKLVVQLSVDLKNYENSFRRAQGVTTRQARSIESRFAQMNSRIGASVAALGRRMAIGLAAGLTVGTFTKFSDAATRIDNALKVAGLSGEQLEKVYERLRTSAMANAAPIEELVTLYSRASQAAGNLGASQEDLTKFADNVALSLRVSGKSAQEASGALLQLSQLLGGNIVQAQEYNSLIDGAYPLLQAVAAGLEDAGGDVGKLTQLVKAGKVPTKAFFDAFQAGAVVLQEKVAGSSLTTGQALGNLQTAIVHAARQFNQATGTADRLAEGINNLAKGVSDLRIVKFFEQVASAIDTFNRAVDKAANNPALLWLAETLSGQELTVGAPISLETVEAEKDIANLDRQIGILKDRIEANKELAIDSTEANAQLDALLAKVAAARSAIANVATVAPPGTPGNPNSVAEMAAGATRRAGPPAKPKKVKLGDYDPPGDDKKGGRTRQSDYARETEQIRERTAALQAETAAMAGLNPLMNDYGFAMEKARAEHELLTAAQSSGLTITPELKAQIEQLATAYAQASVDAERLAESQDMVRERLAESQDMVRERAQEMADLGKDVFGGFIRDLRNGVSAADALKGALERIADALLNNVLDAIFQVNGAGGGGGIIGSILGAFGGGMGAFPAAPTGGLFADGGYTGQGGKHQPKGVVHGGEYVFSKEAVQRAGVGNLEAMHRSLKGYATGGLVAPAVPRIGASAAGGNVVIKPVVNNNSSRVAAETQTRTNSDGSVDIITTINDVVAKGAVTRGSPVNNALRKGFGAQQALKRR